MSIYFGNQIYLNFLLKNQGFTKPTLSFLVLFLFGILTIIYFILPKTYTVLKNLMIQLKNETQVLKTLKNYVLKGLSENLSLSLIQFLIKIHAHHSDPTTLKLWFFQTRLFTIVTGLVILFNFQSFWYKYKFTVFFFISLLELKKYFCFKILLSKNYAFLIFHLPTLFLTTIFALGCGRFYVCFD